MEFRESDDSDGWDGVVVFGGGGGSGGGGGLDLPPANATIVHADASPSSLTGDGGGGGFGDAFARFDAETEQKVGVALRDAEDRLHAAASAWAGAAVGTAVGDAAAAAEGARRSQYQRLGGADITHRTMDFGDWAAAFPHLRVCGVGMATRLAESAAVSAEAKAVEPHPHGSDDGIWARDDTDCTRDVAVRQALERSFSPPFERRDSFRGYSSGASGGSSSVGGGAARGGSPGFGAGSPCSSGGWDGGSDCAGGSAALADGVRAMFARGCSDGSGGNAPIADGGGSSGGRSDGSGGIAFFDGGGDRSGGSDKSEPCFYDDDGSSEAGGGAFVVEAAPTDPAEVLGASVGMFRPLLLQRGGGGASPELSAAATADSVRLPRTEELCVLGVPPPWMSPDAGGRAAAPADASTAVSSVASAAAPAVLDVGGAGGAWEEQEEILAIHGSYEDALEVDVVLGGGLQQGGGAYEVDWERDALRKSDEERRGRRAAAGLPPLTPDRAIAEECALVAAEAEAGVAARSAGAAELVVAPRQHRPARPLQPSGGGVGVARRVPPAMATAATAGTRSLVFVPAPPLQSRRPRPQSHGPT